MEKNKNIRQKKIVWFIVTIIILLCVSAIVVGILFVFVLNKNSHSSEVNPKISNTIDNQQLIQKDIENFVNQNNWFTNKNVRDDPQFDATIKIDNLAQWNTHFKNVWSEQIRVNDKKTYFLNLQNVTIDKLNDIIDNSDLWSANQLYFQDKTRPYIPNNGASKQLINNVLVTFIKKNRWFNTKPNDTGALPPQISIGTVPDNNTTNDGVQWNVGQNGNSSYWSIRILSGSGSTWTTFTTLNLGNFQTEDQLNTLIQNPTLWENSDDNNKALYFIEDLTADAVIKAVNNYLNNVNTKSGGFHEADTATHSKTYKLECGTLATHSNDFYTDTVNIKNGSKAFSIEITGKSSYSLEQSTKVKIKTGGYFEGPALTEKIISDTVKSYLHGKVFHLINDAKHYTINFDGDVGVKDNSTNKDFTNVTIGIKISNDKDSNIIKKNITIQGITTTLLTTSTENQIHSLKYEEGNPVDLSGKQIVNYITTQLEDQIKQWESNNYTWHLLVPSGLFPVIIRLPGHHWRVKIEATTTHGGGDVKDFFISLKITIVITKNDVVNALKDEGYTPLPSK